jgi:carbon storage regulator CsrA
MLVLKRRTGQKIYIDDGVIEIELLWVGDNWVKLGITAPAGVQVARDDILPEGPSRCCRCGGDLPPGAFGGQPPCGQAKCSGSPDSHSGRCGNFLDSALWGDALAGDEKKDGAA